MATLWQDLKALITRHTPDAKEEGRALTGGRLYSKLSHALQEVDRESGSYNWLIDIYVEDGQALSAIVARDGKLFQVGLSVSDDDVALGEWVQVTEMYAPVEQSRLLVQRGKNGDPRWLMIAATSVLNRVGEIDSTDLFDSFVERAEETGKYPRLDFYHMGKSDPGVWEFGTADYLARDGSVYIASGTFDSDHPLALAVMDASQREPGRWGGSIEFRALGDAETLALDPDVKIPVYRSGENTRISIVEEVDSAGWFTRIDITEVARMQDQIKQKLAELFGEDDESLGAFAQLVDGTNRAIEEQGLVTRSAEGEEEGEGDPAVATGEPGDPTEGEEEGEEEPSVEGNMEAQIELDDIAARAIAQMVLRSPQIQRHVRSMEEMQGGLSEVVEAARSMEESYAENTRQMVEIVGDLADRVAALEGDDEERQREWLQDLPSQTPVRITHRPRHENGYNGGNEGIKTAGEIAERTLAGIDNAY